MRRSPALALGLALLAASPAPATATTVVPVTVEALARRADLVVVARVRAAQPVRLGGLIHTDLDLEVLAALRGTASAGDHLALRTPGGTLGAITQVLPGVPALEPGRAYVLFLSRAPDGSGLCYLAHLTAAALPVVVGPDGAPRAMPPAEGLVAPADVAAAAAAGTEMLRAGLPLERLAGAVLR